MPRRSRGESRGRAVRGSSRDQTLFVFDEVDEEDGLPQSRGQHRSSRRPSCVARCCRACVACVATCALSSVALLAVLAGPSGGLLGLPSDAAGQQRSLAGQVAEPV